MRRRGHMVLLVMTLVAATLALGAAFTHRASVDLLAQRAEEQRVVALWLARSAQAQGWTGARALQTEVGVAQIRASAAQAEARLGPWRAVVGPTAERVEQLGEAPL